MLSTTDAARVSYPPADRDDTVEVLHGTLIADPYRYLEDPDAARTRAFVDAQNAVSQPYLASLAATAPLRELTSALLTAPRRGVPWERGGRYFVIANPGELDQDQLFTAASVDELINSPILLVDPNTLSADGTVAMTAARVSPQGRYVALALAEAGSDWRTIRVRDVATGSDLPDELRWTKWIDPTWLPDESGFFYWCYPEPTGAEFTTAMGAGELRLHRLGGQADELVWSRPEAQEWMADPWVTADGAWLVLTTSPGTDSRSTVQARRLVADAGPYRVARDSVVVVGDLTDAQHVVGSDGDTLYLRTERGAPRGRLVAVDLSAVENPWSEVVAQHDVDVLVDAYPAAGAFVLLWSSDAAHRVQIVDRAGRHRAWPELPAPISVTAINARAGSAEVFVGVTSFTRRGDSFRLDVGPPEPELTQLPVPVGGEIRLPAVTFERWHATSVDSVAVPMTLLRRADLPDGPRATLLYGYGGFDIPVLPAFSAMFAAWVAVGGVLAVANLRGGGEFGAQWHQAGMLQHKQLVFDDLYACARRLIDSGVTSPAQLALHGRSNGGLLVGAAMTQHPELFAAALPTVGVLDMLRFQLFTIGWAWTTEYGSPDSADDFAVLLAYSPLHNLRQGTHYPATLICTGDHDDRVVPAHSLKFGAELQRCQAGTAPVLLRVDTRAGHGMGKPASALAAEYADQLAFAAEHTGLVPMAAAHRDDGHRPSGPGAAAGGGPRSVTARSAG